MRTISRRAVQTVEPLLERTSPHYTSDPDLHRVALNSVSWIEAYIAVELLAESEPPKVLVTIANLREAIKELPRFPLAMAVDFETLAKVWQLEREDMAWSRTFSDEAGEYSVVVLGEGSYCYDVVIRTEDATLMWQAENGDEDLVNPLAIDLVMQRPGILGKLIDLLQAMGLPFNPVFYMSLEDWRQEYAQTVFQEVMETFRPGDVPLPPEVRPKKPKRTRAKAETRTRH